MIDNDGLPNNDLSFEENIQFIPFRHFITIFYKFREEKEKYVDLALKELGSYYDFSENSDIAVFNNNNVYGLGVDTGKSN